MTQSRKTWKFEGHNYHLQHPGNTVLSFWFFCCYIYIYNIYIYLLNGHERIWTMIMKRFGCTIFFRQSQLRWGWDGIRRWNLRELTLFHPKQRFESNLMGLTQPTWRLLWIYIIATKNNLNINYTWWCEGCIIPSIGAFLIRELYPDSLEWKQHFKRDDWTNNTTHTCTRTYIYIWYDICVYCIYIYICNVNVFVFVYVYVYIYM